MEPRKHGSRTLLDAVLLCACVSVSVVLAACAVKAPPAAVGAPKHPDYMFPTSPPNAAAAQVVRMDRGWQYLQLDDFRNAEREFASALREESGFHPAETGLAYLSLARAA
jgi:Tfp pilus assembly protein PilF